MLPKYLTSFENMNKTYEVTYTNLADELKAIQERAEKTYKTYTDEVKELVKAYEENKNSSKTKSTRTKKKNDLLSIESSTIAETSPQHDVKPPNLRMSGKPKRLASQVASAMISKVSHITDNTKLRRPSGGLDLLDTYKKTIIREQVAIKKEREDSYIASENLRNQENINTTNVTNVTENEMPPPAVPKGRRGRPRKIKAEVDSSDTDNESSRPVRSTRTKRNQKKDEEEEMGSRSRRNKTSDVLIIPDEPVPVIDLINSSVEESVNSPQESTNVVPESPKEKEIGKNKNATKNRRAIQSSPEKEAEEPDPEIVPDPIEPPVEKEVVKSDDKKRTKRNSCSSEEEILQAKKRTKKTRTKTAKKAAVPEKVPIILIENIKLEKTNEESEKVSTPKPIDQTFEVTKAPSKPVLNETFVPVMNSTYCTSPALDATVTIEKPNKNLPFVPEPTPASKKANETNNLLKEINEIIKPQAQVRVSIERNPVVEKLIEEKTEQPKETVKKDHWQKPAAPVAEPLLTDDDSDISPAKSIPKTPVNKIITTWNSSGEQAKSKKSLKTKAMFSPSAESPVRKRIAAYENLSEKKPIQTTRVTRTKTKKILEEKENEKARTAQKQLQPPKYVTPLKPKSMIPTSEVKAARPGLTNTASKQNISNSSTNSNETVKNNSAVKLTRAEQIMKQDDAQKKKIALMHAKTEESKRIREEKMLRAQKAREEKERLKEEKLKQILAEKEEKIREEQEQKKKYLAKKATEAEEQRRLVEQNRLLRQKEEEEKRRREQRKLEHEKNVHKYRLENEKKYKHLPTLPTPDAYDSDDETVQREKPVYPEWSKGMNLLESLKKQNLVPKEIIKKFFNMKPITPDLETIFDHIPKAYLRRNSSAVWRTPPRYSTLPK